MKLLTHIPSWLKNKYFLTLSGFIVWMLFFDERDFFTISRYRQELKELQQSKNYYTAEIKANQDQLHITSNTLEKIAREKYYMKRDNEDLFLIKDEKPQ
jgi:cell division protein DivIC